MGAFLFLSEAVLMLLCFLLLGREGISSHGGKSLALVNCLRLSQGNGRVS